MSRSCPTRPPPPAGSHRFYRGRELDDGSGLLQGSGKDARFITLRTPADVERPEIKRMARKAFKLAARQHWPRTA
jgi:hypothetical protein